LVGLFGREISAAQGLSLHKTAQNSITRIQIHDSKRIRIHDPSVREVKTIHTLDRMAADEPVRPYLMVVMEL